MPIQTPICDFGQKAHNFKLKSTDNKIISLDDVKGENGTLIMFICNHCPYVKAVTKDIVEDCKKLKNLGVNSVAICANDAENYPDTSYKPNEQSERPKCREYVNETQFVLQEC